MVQLNSASFAASGEAVSRRGLDDDMVRQSRDIIAKGSKSFAGAARFFDPRTRASVYLLYAWCRYCDDQIDSEVLGFRNAKRVVVAGEKQLKLAQLERETELCLTGQSSLPVFQGLARVIADYAVDMRFPRDLLAGLRMDAQERRYDTLDELLEYCYCVAGTVGIMMGKIMGVRTTPQLQRACDLGIALQLTNIARDVIDDAGAGRVYLPGQWLADVGLTRADLDAVHRRTALATAVGRLLSVADQYYLSASYGLPALPFRSAWAVATAASVYGAIGTEVRRAGPTAWNTRATVPQWRKLTGAGEGLLAALGSQLRGLGEPTPSRHGLWTPPALLLDAS